MEWNRRVDLILISENSPKQLKECLSSCQAHLEGLSSIEVLYHATDESEGEYLEVQRGFSEVCFTRLWQKGKENLKKEILSSLWRNAHSCPYVILSTDQVEFQKKATLPLCVAALQKTQAFAFYFHLGNEGGENVNEGIYAWNIRRAQGEHRNPDALRMGLYRRLELENELKGLSFKSVHDLVKAWAENGDRYRVGLSFEVSKVSSTSSETLIQS